MYQIKSNVPLAPTLSSGRASRFPLAVMAVGDMFEVPVPAGMDPARVRKPIDLAAYKFRKRSGGTARFTIRQLEGRTKLGVWRIA